MGIGHYILQLWYTFFFLSSSFFFFFFSSLNLSGRRLDVYSLLYSYTWCGLTANLECTSEMYCMAHWKCRLKNDAKIAIWAPSHKVVGLYLRN